MTPESPCIGVCQLLQDGTVCAGCYRTLSEITAWNRFSDEEKLKVLAVARERKATRKVNNMISPGQ